MSLDPSAAVGAVATNRDARFQLSILAQYIALAYGTAGTIGKTGVGIFLGLDDFLSGNQQSAAGLSTQLLDAVSQREQVLYDSLPDDDNLISDSDRAQLQDVEQNALDAIETVQGAASTLGTGFLDAATTGVKLGVAKVVPTLPALPIVGPIPIWAWLGAAAIGAVFLYRRIVR